MTLSITLPTCWDEMSDPLLNYFARLTAQGFTAESIKCYVVVRTVPTEYLHRVRPDHLVVAVAHLDWLDTPPDVPVRPARLAGGKALPKNFVGVPFEKYLIIENLWQGTLQVLDGLEKYDEATSAPVIRALLEALWPGYNAKAVRPWHIILLLLWLQGLKNHFAAVFPHLFKPSSQTGEDPDMREVMETEIRALTAGDITKRQQVLEADTWTALTELDAKAREAEESSH